MGSFVDFWRCHFEGVNCRLGTIEDTYAVIFLISDFYSVESVDHLTSTISDSASSRHDFADGVSAWCLDWWPGRVSPDIFDFWQCQALTWFWGGDHFWLGDFLECRRTSLIIESVRCGMTWRVALQFFRFSWTRNPATLHSSTVGLWPEFSNDGLWLWLWYLSLDANINWCFVLYANYSVGIKDYIRLDYS